MFRQSFNTIIIGAGPSGLAAGYHLNNIDNLIIEAADDVVKSWLSVWDNFELAQPVHEIKMDGLDLSEFPANYHLKRDEIRNAFKKYAEKHNLRIKYNTQVKVIKKVEGCFVIETTNASYTAHNVILALGARMQPKYPESITKEVVERFQDTIMHSAFYKNCRSINPNKPVLVIGSGLSALSIAKDVKTNMRAMTVSISCAYTDDDITKKHSHLSRVPVKMADLEEMKITNKGRFLGIKHDQLQFERDNKYTHITTYSKIIFATGYDYSFESMVKLFHDRDAVNIIRKHELGITKEPGLYVVGIPNEGQSTVTITQGNIEARSIAKHISENRMAEHCSRFFSSQLCFKKTVLPPSNKMLLSRM